MRALTKPISALNWGSYGADAAGSRSSATRRPTWDLGHSAASRADGRAGAPRRRSHPSGPRRRRLSVCARPLRAGASMVGALVMISRIAAIFAALSLSGLAIAGCSTRTEGLATTSPRRRRLSGFRAAEHHWFSPDERQCGMLIYFSATEIPPNSIKWRVTTGDTVVAAFTIRIAPQGKGTVINIDVPKAPNGGEIYDGKQHYFYPALMQPLRPALRELVDAAIARRPYDVRRLPKPFNTDSLCGGFAWEFPWPPANPSASMTHLAYRTSRPRKARKPRRRAAGRERSAHRGGMKFMPKLSNFLRKSPGGHWSCGVTHRMRAATEDLSGHT